MRYFRDRVLRQGPLRRNAFRHTARPIGAIRYGAYRRGPFQYGVQIVREAKGMAGSTLARRSLGRRLRQLREAAKMSQSAAGRAVELSPQSIGRLEDGQATRTSSLHINALCDAYRVSDSERKVLLALGAEVREAHKSGGRWWRAYADEIPMDFNHYISLEDSASIITFWSTLLIPGLFQTSDYRRALAWTEHPTKTHDEVERLVELASRRQRRLQDPRVTIAVLIFEAALRSQVGSVAVMEEQLLRLAALSEYPNITIQVVPYKASNHLGSLVGKFVLLDFPPLPATKLQEPSVVYVEGFAGSLYLERESEVEQYRQAGEQIRRVALNPIQSRELILETARECAQ
jgi:transcriptional regulator with XRE-family HTH domain